MLTRSSAWEVFLSFQYRLQQSGLSDDEWFLEML
jgi:hypothetical protein